MSDTYTTAFFRERETIALRLAEAVPEFTPTVVVPRSSLGRVYRRPGKLSRFFRRGLPIRTKLA